MDLFDVTHIEYRFCVEKKRKKENNNVFFVMLL